jgi:sigma-B regulation protein RsbU (phosphoserine phosphatase)
VTLQRSTPDGAGGAGKMVLSVRVPARVGSLRLVRRLVGAAASACGCGSQGVRDTVLAVDEACQNVIRHAYGEDASGDILIEIRCDARRLQIDLVDFAPPVDTTRIHPRPLEDLRPGGLGTHFINECMDASEFRTPPHGAGNRLWMAKTIR